MSMSAFVLLLADVCMYSDVLLACAFVCFRTAISQRAALQVYSPCSRNALMALSCVPWYLVNMTYDTMTYIYIKVNSIYLGHMHSCHVCGC